MKRAVLYLRVSTLDQTTANQERELREIAGRMGCEIIKLYKDHGISGAKARDERPAFDALCRDATKRQFDLVMAWSVDRLGRSLKDLVAFPSELHALRIDLFLHQQGLDSRTPAGKAMFQMMGVFAEFERAIVQERVRAVATGVNEFVIGQWLTNWTTFYTGNPSATQGLSVSKAAYGATFGNAIGVALLNPTSANLQTVVTDTDISGVIANALLDNAQGSYAVGVPIGNLPAHQLLQGEGKAGGEIIQLQAAQTGPLVLSDVTNGATLVGDGFGAGNNLEVHGPGGVADAFTMTATSVPNQDWGTMTFSDFENVTLELSAGEGGFDLDLGPITMTPTIGGGNTLNFTGNANAFVSVGLVPGEGLIDLVGGGIINDTNTGVLHFGVTTAAKIVGTTGGGIIMQGIDISPTGVQEFGSETGWNNLAGSIVNDTFTGGKGNVAPGGEGDIFVTNGGADTINLAPGHSANHIEVYGTDGETTTDGVTTVYQGMPGSITQGGTGQPGFWGNITANATNDIFGAFANSGTSATQVTINGFNVGSDVVDVSVGAWQTGLGVHGLLQVVSPDFGNAPVSSTTGTPGVFTGALFSGGSVAGSPAGTDVILFGDNFASATALGSSLHINHFGLFALPAGTGYSMGSNLHELGIYNDVSGNAHIVDIAINVIIHVVSGTFFSDDPGLQVAVSDMAVLVGVNAFSLTGDNIHFVT